MVAMQATTGIAKLQVRQAYDMKDLLCTLRLLVITRVTLVYR